MTTYTIEDGIPLPPSTRSHNQRKPKSPLRLVLDDMKPGQSIFLPEVKEWQKALSMTTLLRSAEGKQFASRKIAGQGWRLWRTA